MSLMINKGNGFSSWCLKYPHPLEEQYDCLPLTSGMDFQVVEVATLTSEILYAGAHVLFPKYAPEKNNFANSFWMLYTLIRMEVEPFLKTSSKETKSSVKSLVPKGSEWDTWPEAKGPGGRLATSQVCPDAEPTLWTCSAIVPKRTGAFRQQPDTLKAICSRSCSDSSVTVEAWQQLFSGQAGRGSRWLYSQAKWGAPSSMTAESYVIPKTQTHNVYFSVKVSYFSFRSLSFFICNVRENNSFLTRLSIEKKIHTVYTALQCIQERLIYCKDVAIYLFVLCLVL